VEAILVDRVGGWATFGTHAASPHAVLPRTKPSRCWGGGVAAFRACGVGQPPPSSVLSVPPSAPRAGRVIGPRCSCLVAAAYRPHKQMPGRCSGTGKHKTSPSPHGWKQPGVLWRQMSARAS
jgi:hypothetical protein